MHAMRQRPHEPLGAAKVVEWVRSHGSDTDNLRDAAHEASHAIQVKPRRWDRESIHAKVVRKGRVFMVWTELEARAVERIVCTAHGVEHEWEHLEFLSFVEASKSGIWLPKDLGLHISRLMTKSEIIERANLILACGTEAP